MPCYYSPMNSDERPEAIAATLVWLGGLVLFVWSWQASGSFMAALIITIVGGTFLLLLVGPLIAVVACLLNLAADLIWPSRN